MPVGYETRECKGGKDQRLCYRQPLRYYEDISQVPPVEPHSREKRKAEHRELADEIHKTKRERRESYPVDKPAQSDALYPQPDERYTLPHEKGL